MTPRERVLAILRGGRPDKVPWFGDLDYWASALIARGENPQNIARGLHQSIVNRIMAMLGNTGYGDTIVFAGGAAKNSCLVSMLEKKLSKKLYIPEEPQIVGALGAALSLTNKKEAQ